MISGLASQDILDSVNMEVESFQASVLSQWYGRVGGMITIDFHRFFDGKKISKREPAFLSTRPKSG